jgi:hypothetical protein
VVSPILSAALRAGEFNFPTVSVIHWKVQVPQIDQVFVLSGLFVPTVALLFRRMIYFATTV